MKSGVVTPGLGDEPKDALKEILEHLSSPAHLDHHPWTESRMVQAAAMSSTGLSEKGKGQQLVVAIIDLFPRMRPATPPRQGKRLDTRWGEFGILAARYFAPLVYGTPTPSSLRDAWGWIDPAIQWFVYGRSDGALSDSEKEKYLLVGNEPEVAPISTLSDWHRNGMKRFADIILNWETHLQQSESDHGNGESHPANSSQPTRGKLVKRIVLTVIASLLLLFLIFAGIKAYRIYGLLQRVRSDITSLEQSLPSTMSLSGLRQASASLPRLDADLTSLKIEVQPLIGLSPSLRWVPTYGGDLSQAGNLLDLAQHLTASAQDANQALGPVLESTSSSLTNSNASGLSGLVNQLSSAQPLLQQAQTEFQQARTARGQLDVKVLSPSIQNLINQKLDPGMTWMGDGLSLAISLPSVLGAGQDGPKTYLLLVQNEDELRPTGGFITAVGKLVVDHGHVVDLSFEDSGSLDNWSMPYPMAPWQLNQYMDSPVLILRDTNWFPDFPTSVLYLKELYAYTHQNTVNGVIAFDQHMLIMLLQTLGPLNVSGVPYPITADNVVGYMRASKSPQAGGQPLSPGGDYKDFIRTIANAIIQKVLSDGPSEWRSLSQTFLQALQERHLILQMDNPDMESVLARRNWNGALYSNGGDFLTVIDTNVGFNKTTAVVGTSLAYDVDLTNLSAPVGNLVVSHTNHASADIPCAPRGGSVDVTVEEYYPIDRCYWDYMRIYAPLGTTLISAVPQSIPASWMILNQPVAPQVDVLNEGEPGLQGFGTMLVVPGGQTITTTMQFALPAAQILMKDAVAHTLTYNLTIRKQPGTVAVPLTLRIHLPNNVDIISASSGGTVQGKNLLFQTNLNTDVNVQVVFSSP
ncbi:MAG TPA: DUF4012 domain-containing protein [Anaerolineales bacterium]